MKLYKNYNNIKTFIDFKEIIHPSKIRFSIFL